MRIDPKLERKYADNGEHSHWSVVDKRTGRTIIEDIEDAPEPACNHSVDHYGQDRCSECGEVLPYSFYEGE